MDIVEVRKKTGRKINQLRRMVWNRLYRTWHLLPVLTYGRSGGDEETVFIMIYSMYGGGAERVASILANGLSEKYRVVTICHEKKDPEYYLNEQIERVYTPVHFRGPIAEQKRQREYFVRTYKRIRKPVASISFMYAMNDLNVHTKCGDAVICSERNNPAMREPEHMKDITSFYREADHVVFQSSSVRDLFDSRIAAHSSIIMNPVNVSCCRNGHAAHRIVNVGRLHPQKNQALLIRAFADFQETHPEYTLELYGEGEMLDELMQLAESLGLAGRVIFHGNVENVHGEIADAMMFVLSSDFEGLSNALLECMMMGMPCISTDCTGSVDVIRTGENGILVERGNKDQLADAMTLLAEDDELREKLGRNAGITAEEFKPEKILAQWMKLIDSLKKERN